MTDKNEKNILNYSSKGILRGIRVEDLDFAPSESDHLKRAILSHLFIPHITIAVYMCSRCRRINFKIITAELFKKRQNFLVETKAEHVVKTPFNALYIN